MEEPAGWGRLALGLSLEPERSLGASCTPASSPFPPPDSPARSLMPFCWVRVASPQRHTHTPQASLHAARSSSTESGCSRASCARRLRPTPAPAVRASALLAGYALCERQASRAEKRDTRQRRVSTSLLLAEPISRSPACAFRGPESASATRPGRDGLRRGHSGTRVRLAWRAARLTMSCRRPCWRWVPSHSRFLRRGASFLTAR